MDSCEDTFTTTENKSKTKALENVSVFNHSNHSHDTSLQFTILVNKSGIQG